MLPRPTSLVDSAWDLRIAFNVDGAWDWNWQTPELGEAGLRLRVEEIAHGYNNIFPQAKLSLCLAGQYDDAGGEILRQLTMSELDGLIPPDSRMVVYVAQEDSREFLFEGYPAAGKLAWSGHRGSEGMNFGLTCVSLLERLGKEHGAWVRGRHVHRIPKTGEEKAPPTQFCDGLPGIFNFRGTPNRAEALANIELPGGEEGETIKIPVFTYDGDPNAKFWKWADVLAYLLHFYLNTPLGSTYPLQDGNGMQLCSSIVSADGAPESPDDPNNLDLEKVLRSRAEELTVQSVSLVTALQRLCALAGLGMQQWTCSEAGEPRSKLLFWLQGDGGPFRNEARELRTAPSDQSMPVRAFALDREDSSMKDRDPADVLRSNELSAGELNFDASAVVNSADVIGRVDVFECTMGKSCATLASDIFKPLWAPDTLFGDNLSGSALTDKLLQIDRVVAEAYGEDLTMFSRYTRGGSGHADYLEVGRLWGLNESGEYGMTEEVESEQLAVYRRTNGGTTCWNSEAYTVPYNFHANCEVPRIKDGSAGEDEDGIDFMRRRRRVLQPLSRLGDNRLKIRPRVLASWDSGVHWYEYPGSVRFLEDQCSLLLLDDNLARVTNESAPIEEAGARESVWAAIVKGTFRLAVTASIEGDQRTVGISSAAHSFGGAYYHREVNAHDHFGLEKRCNSELVGHAAYDFDDVDESAEADGLANRIVAPTRQRLIAGTVVCPWLRTDWLPGERCRGIEPRGVQFTAATGNDDEGAPDLAYPAVAFVRWVNNDGNQVTQITLDDPSRALSKAAAAEITHKEANLDD